MERVVIPELLDEDLGTLAEVESSLQDLAHINAWFGGVRTTAKMVRRVAKKVGTKELSLVEIGSGHGELPFQVRRALADDGIRLGVTLLDHLASHLPANGAPSIVGDVRKLPFGDRSFDIVSCSLLAHHFEEAELQSMARSALRVSRRAVLINDLIRSPLHLALTYSGLPLFRSRITWHDAPASVRRAYTREEMANMLEPVCPGRVEITSNFLYRMGVILWK